MPDGIGEALRGERLAQGIELSEVEERTKIRIRYLRALEAEDWDAMPGDAYVRGFLRTYGEFLGLDGALVVEEYARLARPTEAEPRAEPIMERPRRAAGGMALSRGQLAAIVGVGLVVVLLLIGVLGGGGGNEATKDHGGRTHRHAGRHQVTTTTSTTPTQVTVRLDPTADVWVCLVDQTGKPLVNGQVLAAGDQQGPFTASAMKLSLGNGEVKLEVNGSTVAVPASPNPLGFSLTPSGAHQLAQGARPTCT